MKKLFEPVTKAVTDASERTLKESKSTTKAIEELNETNVQLKFYRLTRKLVELIPVQLDP